MTTAEDLAPVRNALLERAHADADRMVADARAEAARRIETAERVGADILDRARESGTLDAAARTAAQRGQASGHARDAVLAAQREVYEKLVARVTAAIEAELVTDAARTALRGMIAAELGPGAVLTDLPHGVSGSVPGRRLVVDARQLADRGLARCGGRIRELWTS